MPDQPDPTCFYCDDPVGWSDAKLTSFGKVYGPCCNDLGTRDQL